MDFICGTDAAECTPKILFENLGDATENPYVPFQMNYITDPIPGLTPFNRSTVACNETVTVSIFYNKNEF